MKRVIYPGGLLANGCFFLLLIVSAITFTQQGQQQAGLIMLWLAVIGMLSAILTLAASLAVRHRSRALSQRGLWLSLPVLVVGVLFGIISLASQMGSV